MCRVCCCGVGLSKVCAFGLSKRGMVVGGGVCVCVGGGGGGVWYRWKRPTKGSCCVLSSYMVCSCVGCSCLLCYFSLVWSVCVCSFVFVLAVLIFLFVLCLHLFFPSFTIRVFLSLILTRNLAFASLLLCMSCVF